MPTLTKTVLLVVIVFFSSAYRSQEKPPDYSNLSLILYIQQKSGWSDAEWKSLYAAIYDVSQKSNLPVDFIIGLMCRESAYGSSELAREAYNLFGIKGIRGSGYRLYFKEHKGINPSTGRFEMKVAPFRHYSSREESVYDLVTFFKTGGYDFSNCRYNNTSQYLSVLAAKGYAEDKNHSKAILRIITRDYTKYLNNTKKNKESRMAYNEK